MAKQAPSVTLDRGALELVIWAIALIDEKLDALKGTQAQRLNEARLAILDDALPVTFSYEEVLPEGVVVTFSDAVQWLEHVKECVEVLEQWGDEAVSSYLKAQKKDHDQPLEQLKEERGTLVDQAKALTLLLGSAGVDVSGLDIPKRSGGGRPAGSGNVKVSGAHWYVVTPDGTRKDMSESQDKLSSVAFYHGEKIHGDKSTKALREAMGKPDETKAFEAEVNGWTIGLEITE